MNPLSFLYTEFLWRPLFNGLVWFYTNLPWQDAGLAVVALTTVITLILTPLRLRAQRSQRELAALQPEIKRIQGSNKNDREKQGKAMMELYATHKVNPFSGCLLLLIQMPVLIAIFQVFRQGFEPRWLSYLYSFVTNPGTLNPVSFGFLNLSQGNIYLGLVAAAAQFFQTKLSVPPVPISTGAAAGKMDFGSIFQKQSTYLFPLLIIVWSITLPSALTLYWTVMNVLGIVQEIVLKNRGTRNSEKGNKATF